MLSLGNSLTKSKSWRHQLASLTGIVLALMFAQLASAGHVMLPGDALSPGDRLVSKNQRYELQLESGGNLVLRTLDTGEVLWSTGTDGEDIKRFKFKRNGNLLLRKRPSGFAWRSRTAGTGADRLALTKGGKLKLYSSGMVVWSADTPGGGEDPELTVSVNGVGFVSSDDGFINCPGAGCSHRYDDPDARVNLFATPGPGYEFIGFANAKRICTNGPRQSRNDGRCVLDDASRSVVANFQKIGGVASEGDAGAGGVLNKVRRRDIRVKQMGDRGEPTLDYTGFDRRPDNGSGKHATWLGDWNDDGQPEWFVATRKTGTSTLFYSTRNGYKPTRHWYMPSYSVITLDTRGGPEPEYLIKTSKVKRDDLRKTGKNYADWDDATGAKGHTTVLRIPDDPINNPLEPVMFLPRGVPIISGMMDVDGDGHKDLLLTHHLEKAEFVATYYKGKDDSDGRPFESEPRWQGEPGNTSFNSRVHRARWGDLQVIDRQTKRLFVAGAQDVDNNVVYWKYNPNLDTFDRTPTVFDLSGVPQAKRNQLNLTSVRVLPNVVMFSGKDGAFAFFRVRGDNYRQLKIPGLKFGNDVEYTDFWCIPSDRAGSRLMTFVLLRDERRKNSAMEFRIFDPDSREVSKTIKEVDLPRNGAQRITVLRRDKSFDVTKPAKRFVVAHKDGATVYKVKIKP